jgi:hypothetical protein
MMVAQQQPTQRGERTGDVFLPAITGRCALIAPYESRPDRWPSLRWVNHYGPGRSYRTTTDPRRIDGGTVAVRTLGDTFTSYRDHTEAKSLGPDGKPCRADTTGLLARRPVHAAKLVSIGKEMNALEEHLAGLRVEEADRLNTHRRPDDDPNTLARTVLCALPETAGQIASGARLSTRTVDRARAGQSISRHSSQRLIEYARRRAGQHLQRAGHTDNWLDATTDALFAAYLQHYGRRRLCEC